jgi:surface polysaccharide O-acyltransferase-like enzyme
MKKETTKRSRSRCEIQQTLNVQRDYSLDLLKAIAIVLVLLWHIQPFRSYTTAGKFILNVFYNQITLTAVPLFYIISIFIFYSKANMELTYFKHRLTRVFYLYVFWTAVQLIIYCGTTKLIFGYIPGTNLLMSLLVGGPDLPAVGSSVFYFLSNLIILTIVSFLYGSKGDVRLWKGISYLLIISNLVYFGARNIYGIATPYWRIDNFIIYVPVAYLLFNDRNAVEGKFLYLLLYFVASLYDVFAAKTLSPYDRMSVTFGAISLFCLFYGGSYAKRSFVDFLARNSLGIFAIHKYCLLGIIIIMTGIMGINPGNPASSGGFLSMFHLTTGVIAIATTMVAVYLLNKTFLRKFLS